MLSKDLIAALVESDHETDGHPVLPPGSRPLLEKALLALLVSRQDVEAYIDLLLPEVCRLRELGCRHNEPLPAAELELLLARGPSALGDDVLARLMLNPMALGVAHSAIERRIDDLPEDSVWQDAYEESGRRAMERDGIPEPDWCKVRAEVLGHKPTDSAD